MEHAVWRMVYLAAILALGSACGLAYDYGDYQPAAPAGGGAAGAGGVAADCTDASSCPGADDACSTRTCKSGKCGVDHQPMGTPVEGEIAGDCQVKVCDGSGAVINQNDDSDVEDDGNECTQDTCEEGMPAHPFEPPSKHCGMGATTHCNDQGKCVGCTSNMDCLTSTPCASWTCDGAMQTCELTPMGNSVPCGSPLSCSNGVQTNADHCNGAGACQDQGTTPCTPFVCGQNGACLMSCTTTAECASGYYCEGGGTGNGTCAAKKGQGDGCEAADACGGALQCVDKVCCESACTGLCMACSSDKTTLPSGFCFPVYGGTDPDNECAGNCNGQGQCG